MPPFPSPPPKSPSPIPATALEQELGHPQAWRVEPDGPLERGFPGVRKAFEEFEKKKDPSKKGPDSS